MRSLLLALTFVLAGQASANGEINVLTDLDSPFPPGCVAVSLPQDSSSDQNELVNEVISVPSVVDGQAAAQVRVKIWRVGCHDEGFSVVMVRLNKLSGGTVLVPRAFAEAGSVGLPGHVAQLLRHPAAGNVGATGNEITEQGTTYMLAVEFLSLDGETEFGPAEYNDLFTLELFWGQYAGASADDFGLFDIFAYDPQFDPPQTDFPILHGRMSGQYVIDGIPNSGLVLQIGEEFAGTNNVTAIFFTYLNGDPFWVLGALSSLEPGFDLVTMDMYELSGGQFFTVPPGSFSEEDVSVFPIGTMTIEALDCNRLLVGYNFNESGLGAGDFVAERLLRMAGYDCNPWQ